MIQMNARYSATLLYPHQQIVLLAIMLACIALVPSHIQADTTICPSYSQIDKHTAGTPKSAESSIKGLTIYLIAPCKSDLEKSRAIYYWITHNIAYDTCAGSDNNYGYQSAENVLRTRKGVCSGFAALFAALADLAKLQHVRITGYSRSSVDISRKTSNQVNHTWNAVLIDGNWKLLDCAWGAGYINEKRRFVSRPQDHYFLTPPDQFIFDHLPEEPRWQLLDKPITKEQYDKLVLLKPAFFEYGLRIVDQPDVVVKSTGSLTLSLEAPADVVVTSELLKNDLPCDDSCTFVQKQDNTIRISAALPKTGAYCLRLYAKRKSNSKTYDWAADYQIECVSTASKTAGFPVAFHTFHEKDVCILRPMRGTLGSGKKESFKILVPGAESVAVVVDGKWTRLTKNKDTFEGEAEITGESVCVNAKFSGNDAYWVLLKYAVL